MCADLKLLSRYVERYAINYYGPLLWWNQPNFITLSWIKLIFEDLVELIIQLLFIFHIHKNNKGFVLMNAVSFTGSSIISSFIIIYLKQTSQLGFKKEKKVKKFIITRNEIEQEIRVPANPANIQSHRSLIRRDNLVLNESSNQVQNNNSNVPQDASSNIRQNEHPNIESSEIPNNQTKEPINHEQINPIINIEHDLQSKVIEFS